ncbi:MAG: class IV adenylate cyclase [Planctomycetes bacterium]|nr:class IV adenylate cyclase [Planctomycetota bacterium]
MAQNHPMEVEAKYRVPNTSDLERSLANAGARFLNREEHNDTYLRHPCRDFRATDEALRIRVVDGQPWITYKGPRLAGPVKVRPEFELMLRANDLPSWQMIWAFLGFIPVATVAKSRRIFELAVDNRPILVSIDSVEGLGDFAEIERVIDSPDHIEQAKSDVNAVASQLVLGNLETRSYLAMVLETFHKQKTVPDNSETV